MKILTKDKSVKMSSMTATHILIVEDEPMIAEAVLYALGTDGFTATWVDTGQAALSALNDSDKAPFDLIVMDVGLPDINGFELFRQVSQTHDLPVIFLTARAGEVDRVVGLELGADDYIAKPFSPRELCARVRTVLRRLQKAQTATLNPAAPVLAASSPFVVDDARKTIHYCNQKLTLSRTEYRLLEILIASPGHVFTRDALMQQAWEHPEVSADRTVDSHIKMLRNQLRQIKPDDEPIITHRGIGYALKEWA
jgi:two-component system, OmpR family, catabolic regulation response regulator CreB